MTAIHPNARIHTADNVKEALTLIDSNKFSLIISDYSMPHTGAGLDIFQSCDQSGLPKVGLHNAVRNNRQLARRNTPRRKGDLVALGNRN